MDLRTNLLTAIKTGKVVLGSKDVKKALLSSRLKLVLLSETCPQEAKEDILYYSKLAKTPCVVLPYRTQELGALCGKSFPISALGVVDEGESELVRIVKRGLEAEEDKAEHG